MHRLSIYRLNHSLKVISLLLLSLFSSTAFAQQNLAPQYNRIVSLAPSITETLYALHAENKIVAVSDYSNYPAAAKKLPRVGSFHTISIEAILNHKPDMIILLDSNTKLKQQLLNLKLPITVVNNSSLAGIKQMISTLGKLTDQQKTAQQLLDNINATLHKVKQRVSAAKPVRTLICFSYDQNQFYIAGKRDFYNTLLNIAGGQNVYQNTSVKVPRVSDEGILQLNPDVIIHIIPYGNIKQAKKVWQSFSSVSAVKNHRVYFIPQPYAVIPGPRIVNLAETFAQLLHPTTHK